MRADKGPKRIIKLPAIPSRVEAGVVSVPISFKSINGKAIKLTIRRFRAVKIAQIKMPSAFAELGMEGTARSYSPVLASNCTSDLITLDGVPLPVRISGSTKDALKGEKLALEPCNGDISLAAGSHELLVTQSPHNPKGFDISRLIFSSAAGGSAIEAATLKSPPTPIAASSATPNLGPNTGSSVPTISVRGETRSSSLIRISGATQPFWLVLGQTLNEGWHATINGKDLGTPVLADGYANGWYINPGANTQFDVDLTWQPQRAVNLALWISLLASLLSVGIIITSFSRRRKRRGSHEYPSPLESPSLRGVREATHLLPDRTRIILALGMAAGTGAIIAPWVGLIVGIASWYASKGGDARRLIRFAPPLLLLTVAIGIPLIQRVQRFPAFFDWVTHFKWASWVVWIAISALVLDVLLSIITREEAIAISDPVATPLSEASASELQGSPSQNL